MQEPTEATRANKGRSPGARATVGYGVSYVGPRPLPYGQISDVIFVSDASVRLHWSLFELGFIGTNIFGSRVRGIG